MTDHSFPSRRLLDWLNLILVIVVILTMFIVTGVVLRQSKQIADLNASYQQAIVIQNNIQICGLHDSIIAVRAIGAKLGLPVKDIVPPDVTGIPCDALEHPGG